MQTASGAQGSYSNTRDPTLCSRDLHLARPHKNKREMEGNYIPPMPGLLTKKCKRKQIVC